MTIDFQHVLKATRYSMAGLKVLLREQAMRLEIVMAIGSFAMLLLLGGRFVDFLVVGLLSCMIFAVEALNTAIENIVDHLSPEKSDFARDTKDLGSTAVFFLLVANGLYLFAVLLRFLGVVVW